MSSSKKTVKKSRAAKRRAERRTRRDTDNDQVKRTSGHVVTISGNGDYFEDIPVLGTALRLLKPFMKMFLGEGSYKIRGNSFMLGGTIPPLSSDGTRAAGREQHEDFIGFVVSSASTIPGGSTAFALQNFILQPGLEGTFPWLSQIAPAYQEYDILGMVFAYKSLSGSATGANTSLGQVIIATNYDATAPNYTSSKDMLNSEFASSAAPSVDFLHMIECDPHQSPLVELRVRSGAIPSGSDGKFYDFANVQVATQGCQTASQQLGMLYATYDVQFYKTILNGVVSGGDIPTDKFQLTAVSGAHPLGTSQKQTVSGGIGGTINGATGTVYTFPSSISEGVFLIYLTAQGTAAVTVVPILTVNLSYNILQYWSSNSAPDANQISYAPSTGGTSGTVIHAFILQIVATPILPITVTYGTAGTMPTAPCFGDFLVTQLNSGIIGLVTASDLHFRELVQSEVRRIMREESEKQVVRVPSRKLLKQSYFVCEDEQEETSS